MWYNVIAIAFSSFGIYMLCRLLIRLAKTFAYRLSCFIDMPAISWVVLYYPVIWFECRRQYCSYFSFFLNLLFLNWLLLHWCLFKVQGDWFDFSKFLLSYEVEVGCHYFKTGLIDKLGHTYVQSCLIFKVR